MAQSECMIDCTFTLGITLANGLGFLTDHFNLCLPNRNQYGSMYLLAYITGHGIMVGMTIEEKIIQRIKDVVAFGGIIVMIIALKIQLLY